MSKDHGRPQDIPEGIPEVGREATDGAEAQPARAARAILLDHPSRATIVILGAGLALVAALLEAFLVPLRLGSVPVPISVLGAVVITPLLVVWTYRASGSLVLAALPAAVWVVVVLPLSVRTPSGDLVIPGSAVGLAFLVLGLLSAVVGWMTCYSKSLAVPRGTAEHGPATTSPPATRGDAGANR